MNKRTAVCWMLPFVALVALAACQSPPPPPPAKPPARLGVTLNAVAGANPDASGRPSPTVVHVYQLRSPVSFASLDAFELLENDKAVLGEALAARQEFVLQPGTSVSASLELEPSAREFAAVAAFRDIRNARWYASAPLVIDADGDLADGSVAAITVGAAAVSVSIGP